VCRAPSVGASNEQPKAYCQKAAVRQRRSTGNGEKEEDRQGEGGKRGWGGKHREGRDNRRLSDVQKYAFGRTGDDDGGRREEGKNPDRLGNDLDTWDRKGGRGRQKRFLKR